MLSLCHVLSIYILPLSLFCILYVINNLYHLVILLSNSVLSVCFTLYIPPLFCVLSLYYSLPPSPTPPTPPPHPPSNPQTPQKCLRHIYCLRSPIQKLKQTAKFIVILHEILHIHAICCLLILYMLTASLS